MSPAVGRAWQPSADVEALVERAGILRQIRAFLERRGCSEVNTPVLAPAAATDPQIESIAVDWPGGSWWLQSSPEFHMKRLLAAGSGPIYQLAPAFRGDEQGRWHNPEFTLLEWYRPGFDHHQLMDEIVALWQELSGRDEAVDRVDYAGLIRRELDIDIDSAADGALRTAVERACGPLPAALDRDALLDAAMGLHIGPGLGRERPCLVFDYPASQAALARLDASGRASRFELYWRGVELANGFHELGDPAEQRRRFEQDLEQRRRRGQRLPVIDEALLAALEHGLPDCAGVALGVDRLCALLRGERSLAAVLSFPQDRA